MASAETRPRPGPRPGLGLGPREESGPATPAATSSSPNEPLGLRLDLDLPLCLKANLDPKAGLQPGRRTERLNQRLQPKFDQELGQCKLEPTSKPNACGNMGHTEILVQNQDLKPCLRLEDDPQSVLHPPGGPFLVLEAAQKVGLQQELNSELIFGSKLRLLPERQAEVHHLDQQLSQNAVPQLLGTKESRTRDSTLTLKLESSGRQKLEDKSEVNSGLHQKVFRHKLQLKSRTVSRERQEQSSNDCRKLEVNSELLNQQQKVPKPGLNSRTFSPLQPNTSLRTCSTSVFQLGTFVCILLLTSFVNLAQAGPPRPARPPLLSGQPFIVFWGLKDTSCSTRPDLRTYGIEPEGRVAVFYEDTLGNYPYFVDKDTAVNGGLPQHTRLDPHIQKTQGDVEAGLPAPRYLGLGVVRWQEWAPQWSRSGSKQGLYLEATRKLMRRFFPDWTQQEVERWSKVDFEASAQALMTETLREVQRSRPKALWGFSPYPSCSNGTPPQTSTSNYSGGCPEDQRTLNDQLLWLWRRSTAIYPLLSLEKRQGGTPGAALYLSNQIKESLRVASLGGSADDLPVFPLVRSVYASTNTFLSLSDLVSTIGESAALGAAGVIIWDRTETKTERECQDLGQFVSSVLGPYVSNVTVASRLCAVSLCQGRGRCVRLDQNKQAFLHLQPAPKDQTLTEKPEGVNPTAQPSPALRPKPDPAEVWKKGFQCQWFSSPDGDASDQQSPKDGAPSVGGAEEAVGRGLGVPATVSDVRTTTTGAFEGQSGENAGSVSPETTPGTPVDTGDGRRMASETLVLVLVLLVLCLQT